MGECKDEMKKSDKAIDLRKPGFFSKLKKRGEDQSEEVADKFADRINQATERLDHLIALKEKDVTTEKGREEYNRRAVARLRAMRFHLDEIADLADSYGEDS